MPLFFIVHEWILSGQIFMSLKNFLHLHSPSPPTLLLSYSCQSVPCIHAFCFYFVCQFILFIRFHTWVHAVFVFLWLWQPSSLWTICMLAYPLDKLGTKQKNHLQGCQISLVQCASLCSWLSSFQWHLTGLFSQGHGMLCASEPKLKDQCVAGVLGRPPGIAHSFLKCLLSTSN